MVHCSGALHALVADHVVQGRAIFPGAGYLEMARATASTVVAASATLRGVFFLQPLAVDVSGLQIECAGSADGRFEVRGGVQFSDAASLADVAIYCSGACGPVADDGWHPVEHASVRCNVSMRACDVGALYDGFDALGLQYGPGYRTLVHAWGGDGSAAVARLRARATWHGTRVHPADLDDALGIGALTSSGGGGDTQLPFAADCALLQGSSGEQWAVRTRHASPCLCKRDALTTCVCMIAGCAASGIGRDVGSARSML